MAPRESWLDNALQDTGLPAVLLTDYGDNSRAFVQGICQ
jgi:hypothetical protein